MINKLVFLLCTHCVVVLSLRVMTYNIQSGSGMDLKYNLTRQAQVIVDAHVDMVALQEVDNRTLRHADDQTQVLASLTSMKYYAYAKMRNFQGGGYGIAILSKYEIAQVVEYHFHNKTAQECVIYKADDFCQGALAVQFKNGGWWYVTTHLGLQGVQAEEAQELVHFLQSLSDTSTPIMITGDFNSTPDSIAVKTVLEAKFTDAWQACGKGDGFTFNSKAPFERIDYVFYKHASPCVGAQVLNTEASDHRPVVIEF